MLRRGVSDIATEHAEYADQINLCLMTAKCAGEGSTIIETSITTACGFGTLDFAVVNDFGPCTVIDFKFGWGDIPAAKDNIQLADYAVAVWREYQASEVRVVLVQAAMCRVTEHTYKVADLIAAEKRIKAIVAASEADDAPLIAGDWCKYCRAASTCPRLVDHAGEIATISSDPMDMSIDRLAKVLDLGEKIQPLINAARSRAYSIIAVGGNVPGWCLKPGRATRAWKSEPEAMAAMDALAKELGKPDGVIYEPLALRSPAQMEKVLGTSKIAKSAISAHVTTKPGNPKLERSDP